MAKGKKSSGKHYVSKGEVGTNKKLTNAIRREYIEQGMQRRLNQYRALKQGKDVVFTVPNPNTADTRAKFIKERVDGREYLKRMASSKLVMAS